MRFLYKYKIPILITLAAILFQFLSINQAGQENEKGDYYIYWSTGKKFLAGEPIYEFGKDDGTFIYPPFAAFFFSFFARMPFYLSAIAYAYLVNFGLWALSLWLVWKILKHRFPATDITLPFAVACLCSARYYWHNFIWMQANLPVFCATLAGIYYHFQGKRNASYLFLLAGAFFKVTPALILVFLVIKGRWKDLGKLVLLSLPFFALPLAVRGISNGVSDWVDYYHSFLSPFANGKVDGDLISLGLPSLIDKLNAGNTRLGITPMHFAGTEALKIIILVLSLAVLLIVSCRIVCKKGNRTLTGTEICMILILVLMLPGRVWEHHHLALGFVMAYLLTGLHALMPSRRWLWFTVPLFIIGLIGTDTVGALAYDYSQHYCLITLVVIYLLILLWYFEKRIERKPMNLTLGET